MSTRRMKLTKRIASQLVSKLAELPGFAWGASAKALMVQALENELDWLVLVGRLEIREIAKDFEVKI